MSSSWFKSYVADSAATGDEAMESLLKSTNVDIAKYLGRHTPHVGDAKFEVERSRQFLHNIRIQLEKERIESSPSFSHHDVDETGPLEGISITHNFRHHLQSGHTAHLQHLHPHPHPHNHPDPRGYGRRRSRL